MQLPQSKVQASYTEKIKALESHLREATADEIDLTRLSHIQKQLDALAEKYQYDDGLGPARYKLYELQALIHYFNGNDDSALNFIQFAVETRGASYAKAEKLKALLTSDTRAATQAPDPDKMTKEQRRKHLIGLEGWLAFFVLGVCISIALVVFSLFSYPSTFADLSTLQSDYTAALNPVLWFEVVTNLISVGLAIWLLFLLGKHRSLAKTIAIVFLVSNVFFMIIDYAWASSVFDSFGVRQYVETELNKSAGEIGRALFAAVLWVPYFLVSKRVKATLTK